MNRIYIGRDSEGEQGCLYMSAKSVEEAKGICWSSDLFLDAEYIDMRVKLHKTDKGTIKTEISSGELTTKQIIEIGLAWWDCETIGCSIKDFEYIDDETYRCKKCGASYSIRYYGV